MIKERLSRGSFLIPERVLFHLLKKGLLSKSLLLDLLYSTKKFQYILFFFVYLFFAFAVRYAIILWGVLYSLVILCTKYAVFGGVQSIVLNKAYKVLLATHTKFVQSLNKSYKA